MQKFSFENQGSNTYLTYQLSEEETLDTLSLGMLTNNRIPGLASTFFTQRDDQRFIKYNVSSKVPAEDVFSRAVSKRRLIGVFKGVCKAVDSAEDYMIDEQMLQIDMRYIFVDVSTYDTVLICIPTLSAQEANTTDVYSFFRQIMFSTEFDVHEDNAYIAKILNFLNNKEQFSIAKFLNLLEGLESDNEQKQVKSNTVSSNEFASGANFANQNFPAQDQTQYGEAMPTAHPQQMNTPVQGVGAQGMQPNFNQAAAPHHQAKPLPQGQANQASFAVPGGGVMSSSGEVKAHNKNKKQEKSLADEIIDPEDEITFMYLMQHYNKENAAKYKHQQAIKKAKKQREKELSGKGTKNKKKGTKQKSAPADYTVPGAPNLTGMQANPKANMYPNMPNNPMQAQAQVGMNNNQVNPTPYPNPHSQNQAVMYGSYQTPANMQAPVNPEPNSEMPNQIQENYDEVSGFGETTVLNAAGETTVLGADNVDGGQARQPFLIRVKTKERIKVDKDVFRIGKERSFVDYFIADNPSISRSHANIVSREGKHFLVDTNSTNHCYIDSRRIQSNEEVEIKDGNLIRLSDEEFEFHC